MLIGTLRNRTISKKSILPRVSIIIAAYNERQRISQKIQNTLCQNYPLDKIEIIVASDCSSDGTDEIVASFDPERIKLVRSPQRSGKESAQKLAVETSTGDILIFSDVAATLDQDCVTKMVANFNDPSVGCVSSIDRFIDPSGKPSGEGAYVRYEMFLRTLETKVNTLVGLSGSLFAARRELCSNWVSDLDSDFNTLLQSVKHGLRGVLDRESIGYYQNLSDEKKEYDRKVRTVLRGITAFMRNLNLLNPIQYGLFSWQLFSHKLCRWLVPFALIFLLACNLVLSLFSPAFTAILILHLAFYAFSLWGAMTSGTCNAIAKLAYFFVMVNLSILSAWCRYIKGERIVVWTPSNRTT